MSARVRSYLSDNGVRLKKGYPPDQTGRGPRAYPQKPVNGPPRQWQVIEGLLMELRHAEEQRRHWRRLIAQEVLTDPELLALVRLCGVREMIAFALGAFRR